MADGVLLNWVTPGHARASADLVRAGAAAAKRQPPTIFSYVRVALGPAAADKLVDEGARYAAIPAYGANFERMGVKPVDTAIAADTPQAVAPALARWRGAVDEIVLRAVPGADTVEEHLTLVRAARPFEPVVDVLDTQLRGWGVACGDVAPALADAYELSVLYSEHTFGPAAPNVYSWNSHTARDLYGDDWKAARARGAYKAYEQAFDDKRARARGVADIVTREMDARLRQLVRATDRVRARSRLAG